MKHLLQRSWRLGVLAVSMCGIMTIVQASEPDNLTRAEVGALKQKLVAVATAMGAANAGYAKEAEDFNLPTEIYKKTNSPKYDWVSPSVSIRFSGSGEQQAEQAQEQLQQEYERKMAEALAKGNYQEMAALSEEMQKKAGETHLAAVSGRKAPIDVQIHLNTYHNVTLDPDMVIFERPGVIAVLTDNSDGNKNRLIVLFDPVALKETQTLSRAVSEQPESGVATKTAVMNAVIEMVGPAAEIKAWAERVDTAAVLGQLETGR